jgi:hypothetical protein
MASAKDAPAESIAEAPEGVGTINMTGAERRARQSNIDMWRDRFAAMPKVRVRTTEDVRVQINGYTFQIKGKTPIEVPSLVAEVLDQSGRY